MSKDIGEWLDWQHRRRIAPTTRVAKLCLRRFLTASARHHGLGQPLVVSLTSHAPRFANLHRTLQCLLRQTVRPDRVILWLAEEDAAVLPARVRRLEGRGLEIRTCRNIRSYKKIIPTLEHFADAHIVTADDDVYYWSRWLEELIRGHLRRPHHVIAHRVHRVGRLENGGIAPYAQWHQCAGERTTPELNFATGVGGVLYPSGCLGKEALNQELFLRLCPTGDDIWLHWMTRLNGRVTLPSDTARQPANWPGTEKTSLWRRNIARNDDQIQAMVRHYGLPWALLERHARRIADREPTGDTVAGGAVLPAAPQR